MVPPARLTLDGAALVHNWQALRGLGGGAACGAAVKANGYGLGAGRVVERLAYAGCRDFFVATWGEAAALADLVLAHDLSLSVLHGVRERDMSAARDLPARPVLSTPEQVARWRAAGGGACDVMIDTGMNRLGLAAGDLSLLDGLEVETLMSHLACAEEASEMNGCQRNGLAALAGRTGARRMSLANSAGIALGPDYAFDLTRPGLALYGGVPCEGLAPHIRPVAAIEAEVLQRRLVPAGATVGYNATWTASAETPVAVINLGYADGLPRALGPSVSATWEGAPMPVIGRVSMDLIALDASAAPGIGEGEMVRFDIDLPAWAAAAGRSQYELLTGLGQRFERVWRD
ncbi:alanine racemase [Sphingomonas spermidinifaciens]|uniref:alanine racemase n=1 Tax=Sphingomonas spermidinifaciens TaxID=1141889 RepID=A0A2A4B9Y0_9SPHN|nr:alanine racemase [Sphingomonas spermidinifaciens]PCD04762.1 alanine racemase [Sphingomonas spermidinifaciens]